MHEALATSPHIDGDVFDLLADEPMKIVRSDPMVMIGSALIWIIALSANAAEPAFRLAARNEHITFSGSEDTDTLALSIEGRSCENARFTLVVQSKGGAELYRYESPYSG